MSDADNVEVKKWGKFPEFTFKPKSHIDLALDLDIVDVERAGKVAGARFFYFKGLGVLLDYALMNFAMDTLRNNGYTLIEPPYMMKREAYERNKPWPTSRCSLQNRKRRPLHDCHSDTLWLPCT
jgi:seryl-tRNA synthetase